MNNTDNILVGIYCITYNHKDYLHQCLDGFVMQQTNFRFVAIVHDDCSTDGTTDILREYAEKYPDIIHPIYEEENQWSKHDGSLEKIMDTAFEKLGCKYIAMCEGDDYWTDPLKLQKQVDFMETHPDYSMCLTNSGTLYEDGKKGIAIHTIWDTYDTEHVLLHNSLNQCIRGDEIVPPAHTSTIFYRNPMVATPDWFKKCFIGDEPLIIWMSTFGKVKFLNEVTSMYRQNVGVSSRNFSFEKDFLNRIVMYKAIDEGLGYRYHKLICRGIIAQYYKKLAKLYYKNSQYARFVIFSMHYASNMTI